MKQSVTISPILILLTIIILIVGCTQQNIQQPTFSSSADKTNSPISTEQKSSNAASIQQKEILPTEEDAAFDAPVTDNTQSWAQTSGPLGGTVIRMVQHDKTIWASLYSGGIYELQPDNSWKQIAVGHGIPEVRAFDIVTDPTNTNIAYVPETLKCTAKTINNGATWVGLCDKMLKSLNSPNFNTNTLALDPQDSKIIYAPGNTFDDTSVLVVSKDAGEHWERSFTFDKPYKFNHLFFFDSKMYLATLNDGVLVSSDKGKSWKSLNHGLEELTTTSFVSFKNELYLLAALRQHNTRQGGSLYRLSSDQSSWEKISELSQVTGLGTDGNTLFVGTLNPDPKLWLSIDGHSFEETISQGLPQDWVGEIVRVNSKIYVGAGGNGIFVSSDNGNTFQEFNKGMISVATHELHVNPLDENEIYVGPWDRLGFFWSKNAGNGYHRIATDYQVIALAPDPHDFSKVYIGGDRFAFVSVSKEKSQIIEKKRPGKNDQAFVKSITIDPRDSNHLLAGVGTEVAETPAGEGLWESHDGAESWTRADGIGNFAVYSILFNPTDPSLVYASALGEGVFKSTDGGTHFQKSSSEQLKYTYRLAMSPANPKILVASSNLFFGHLSDEEQTSGKYGGIFQTLDGGTTWKELTKGIRNYEGGDTPEDFLPWLYNFGHMPNYENILIDPKDPNHLVVGHHGENVVETTDGGTTWKKAGASEMVPSGVHNYAYCLGASPSFKKIYACTCGRGLFRGLMNQKGYISLSLTGDAVYDEQPDDHFQPRNAKEAKAILLSGEYNHEH